MSEREQANMSEIPVQAPTRGAHEAGEEYDDQDTGAQDAGAQEAGEQETAEQPTADYGSAGSDVDLDSDPFADDLSKELTHAAPKKWINRTTLVVGGLVLIVGGFLGGVQVQKHYGKTSTASPASAFANLRAAGGFTGRNGEGFPAGGRPNGGASTAPTAAPAQTGTVKLVDGSTIYVTLADGTILTVSTSKSTKVSVATTSKLGALKAGQKITVVGSTPDSSGNVKATAVTASK
jgi:Cu/Ag efflux protein CusF